MSCKKTSIGGQAVIEGIMMRGPHKTALCVRKNDKSIATETWPTHSGNTIPWYKKTPFIRGVFNMVDTLMVGMKCLMRSADIAGESEEEPSKFEKWLSEKTGINIMTIVSVVAMVLGLGISCLLFIVLPTTVSSFFRPWISSTVVLTLLEGIMKVIILTAYMALCTLNKDVARVFEYHGAEHKTIACYEAGLELTVENCRKQIRFHPRCGTSFLILILLVSIIIFAFVPTMNPFLRMLFKLVLLPLEVGIGYELIKLAGRCDNVITRIFSAPGVWLQHLTTREPDDSMLEIAIAAMKEVIPENQNDDIW